MSELCEGLVSFDDDYDVLCQMAELKNKFFVDANVEYCANQIEESKFFQQLNNPPREHHSKAFSKIKNKWVKKGAIKPQDFIPQNHTEFSNKYFLELTCAGIVKYFISNKSMIQKFSSTYNDGYKKIRDAIEDIHMEYSPILVVENIAQQFLLLSVDLLRKQGGVESPFFSHKKDKFLARRTMIKLALYFLYFRCLPSFFMAHASDLDMERLKQLLKRDYESGVILFQNSLYNVQLTVEKYAIERIQQNESADVLLDYCKRLPIDKICDSDCIHLFELCAKAAKGSFMALGITDNFIIETALAITHHFFDCEITRDSELKREATEMKKLAIKQKLLNHMMETMTVLEFLRSDFSEFV